MNKAIIGGLLAAATIFGAAGVASADEGNHYGHGCTLRLGGDQENPGQMFQYLQDRTNGAAGTPKDIVDAYPGSFDSVGDLIAKKCG
jgi:hypothetical protein